VFFGGSGCLMTHPTVTQVLQDGRAIGFRARVGRNSVFGLCCVRSSDVWTKINGESIATPEDALELYPKLPRADKLVIDLLRDGKGVAVEIAFR
jgi:type II secretory pathway component PulC